MTQSFPAPSFGQGGLRRIPKPRFPPHQIRPRHHARTPAERDLDRLPQLAWLLFLKAYDLESREEDARLMRQTYRPVIPAFGYRWRDWAADENNGATGDELIRPVNGQLLPALRSLSGSTNAEGGRGLPRDLQPQC